eukprot:SAG11_NODE_675_length_7800_cov_6.380730_7_plen_206_part_00
MRVPAGSVCREFPCPWHRNRWWPCTWRPHATRFCACGRFWHSSPTMVMSQPQPLSACVAVSIYASSFALPVHVASMSADPELTATLAQEKSAESLQVQPALPTHHDAVDLEAAAAAVCMDSVWQHQTCGLPLGMLICPPATQEAFHNSNRLCHGSIDTLGGYSARALGDCPEWTDEFGQSRSRRSALHTTPLQAWDEGGEHSGRH